MCRGNQRFSSTNVITVKTAFFRFVSIFLWADDDYIACYSPWLPLPYVFSLVFFSFGIGRVDSFVFVSILTKKMRSEEKKGTRARKSAKYSFWSWLFGLRSLWAITWFPRGDKCAVYFHEFFSFSASQLHGNSMTKITSHKHNFHRHAFFFSLSPSLSGALVVMYKPNFFFFCSDLLFLLFAQFSVFFLFHESFFLFCFVFHWYNFTSNDRMHMAKTSVKLYAKNRFSRIYNLVFVASTVLWHGEWNWIKSL